MPFGDTAKKLKKLSQTAEKLYAKMNDLVDQIQDVRDRVDRTGERIEAMDRELAEQRAIVEALAEKEGIDVDEVVADATTVSEVGEDEPEGETEADASGATDGEAEVESVPVEDGTDSSSESA